MQSGLRNSKQSGEHCVKTLSARGSLLRSEALVVMAAPPVAHRSVSSSVSSNSSSRPWRQRQSLKPRRPWMPRRGMSPVKRRKGHPSIAKLAGSRSHLHRGDTQRSQQVPSITRDIDSSVGAYCMQSFMTMPVKMQALRRHARRRPAISQV